MSAIFISHSSKDAEVAKSIEQRLAQRHHHSVFLDLDPEKGIVGGQSWERTLYRKLRSCRAVIAVCTDDYLRSHWCFAEIALARMEGKPVIALLSGALSERAAMPAILTERQLIDLRTNEAEGLTRLWRALEELDLTGVASEWNPREPPYLGLNAYQEEHAPVFFGREEESLAGVELLDRGAPGLIMVLGASGSGKSSLVRAGILPRLRSRDDWLILDPFRPGRDPWAELTESLVQGYVRYANAHRDESGSRERIRRSIRSGWTIPAATSPPAAPREDAPPAFDDPDQRVRRLIDLLEQLHDEPAPMLSDRLRDYLAWTLDDLRRICSPEGSRVTPKDTSPGTTPLLALAEDLSRLSHRRGARVLLVIDQFEELLGREQSGAEVGQFLALLRASLDNNLSGLSILCTMRSDFLGAFQHHPALQGVDFESLSLGPMRLDGIRRVIERPARLAAIEIEDGLVDRLLADTETPDALPLLSFTLWVMCRDRREDQRLELAAYERLGGLQGTITREADAVLASAAREGKQDDLRHALLQMARLSEDGSYVRRAVDWESPDIQRVDAILSKLVDRRVLVSRMAGDRRVIEVAHEALFRAWAPLRGWLENARAELLLKQQIERDAATWRDNGRTPDALWRGGRLLQARELIGTGTARRPGVEEDIAAEFVRAGTRRRTRQRATLVSTVAAVMAVLAGFLGFALVQADRARKERSRALDIARVALAADWLQKDPTSAALVLLEVEDPTTRFLPRRLGEALARGFAAAEYRHTGPVESVAISADGARVLTTSGKTALIWEARTARLLRTLQHDDAVIAAGFDPTGRFVVTRSGEVGDSFHEDQTGKHARVWETETGVSRFTVTHAAALNGAVFSPDGRFLVTMSDDTTAQLWDVSTGRLRFTLKHENPVGHASFRPDGAQLLTVSYGVARVWTLDSDQPVLTLPDASSASFAPDGNSVVTAGRDGLKVWDIKTGGALRTFAHDSARAVSFSPDGGRVLSISDSEVRVWEFQSGAELFKEPITQRDLELASFSQDGSLVITVSGHRRRQAYGNERPTDNAVRYWDVSTGESRAVRDLHGGSELMTVAFGPGQRAVVFNSAHRVGGPGRRETFRADPTARLQSIDTQDGRRQRTLPHEDPVKVSSFSPDGTRVLTVAGAAARLWDAATGAPQAVLKHEQDVTAAVFTPDGRSIVTASRDRTARIWDVDTGQQRFAAKHQQAVEDAVLVANGRLLATISASTARLWMVTSGTAEIGAQRVEISEGDFTRREDWSDNLSPDGTLLVTRSSETAQVWDVATGQIRFTLKHGGWVRVAAFSADGRLLVTGGDEKVARIWDMTTGQPKYTFEHATTLAAVAVSPDKRLVLTLQEDGTAHLWDTTTGKDRFTLQHGCGADDARFIAGSSLAVTWSRRGGDACPSKLMVWEVATGAARSSMDTTGVESVGFSQDGKVAFTSARHTYRSGPEWLDAQEMVRVWDVDTGEERFADPFRSRELVTSAALSPDGGRLVTASGSTASTWAVGGVLLQSALAAATTVCLPPDFRRQNLGESDDEARRAYDACERKHGRH